MKLTEVQKKAIRNLIASLKEILVESQINFLYPDPGPFVQIDTLADDSRSRMNSILDEISNQDKKLEKRIHPLEHVIEPDKTDVYNIQKEIERLAQRIALLESNSQKGWWPFEKGGIVK